jgi:hypothetical protein
MRELGWAYLTRWHLERLDDHVQRFDTFRSLLSFLGIINRNDRVIFHRQWPAQGEPGERE